MDFAFVIQSRSHIEENDNRIHLNPNDMRALRLSAYDMLKIQKISDEEMLESLSIGKRNIEEPVYGQVWPTLSVECGYCRLPKPLMHNGISVGVKVRLVKTTEAEIKATLNAGNDLAKEEPEATLDIKFDDIGGLDRQIKEIKEIIELPLLRPELFTRFGLKMPKGLLMYGPPGTGKTLIAKAVSKEFKCHFISIDGPQLASQFYGETEAKLRKVFEEAAEKAPSIIFIDEIDALLPKREGGSEVDRRVVATMLTLMDGIRTDGHVVVIGATNRPNSLDSALRRGGRFEREIEIGIPNNSQRKDILTKILAKMTACSSDKLELSEEELNEIANTTHGYVGADLSLLIKEAYMISLRDKSLVLNMEHIKIAMKSVRPSAMREIQIEVPNIKWSDIGGQALTKQKLKESVEWPLKYPEVFKRMNITPPKGVLLYGPPGCSKTLLAKALATEAGLNFLAVKGPELYNKYVGESEKAIRSLFSKARSASPSIIFFDEIDAIGLKRGNTDNVSDRVLSQLLNEMDGIEQLLNVTIVAATNRPDMLDAALLRPGRFDRLIHVGLPDYESRLSILEIKAAKMPLSTVDLQVLAKKTEGYSGAELVALCQEAALLAIENNLEASEISEKDIEKALEIVKPRTTPELVQRYLDYEKIVTSSR